ncbi:MAG: hypothetical protein Q7R31_03460 [Candidatus Levybacteria bacterium]|nr:hypothetical protein [Candidatus Levybacteria bacterium]
MNKETAVRHMKESIQLVKKSIPNLLSTGIGIALFIDGIVKLSHDDASVKNVLISIAGVVLGLLGGRNLVISAMTSDRKDKPPTPPQS